MQFKPLFKSYSIDELMYIDTDKRSNKYYLCYVTGELNTGEEFKEYRVLRNKDSNWGDPIVARDENLFWNTKKKELKEFQYKDLIIKEEDNGSHCLFTNYPFNKEYYLKTVYKIFKNVR